MVHVFRVYTPVTKCEWLGLSSRNLLRSRCSITSRNGERERFAEKGQSMAAKETIVSLAPMQFIFPMSIQTPVTIDHKICLILFQLNWKWFLFCSPLNDIYVGIFWSYCAVYGKIQIQMIKMHLRHARDEREKTAGDSFSWRIPVISHPCRPL